MVHLIRNPRGVAHSNHTIKPNPAAGFRMGGISPLRSAVQWGIANASEDRLLRNEGPYLAIGYEEMIGDMRETVRRLVRFVGLEESLVDDLPIQGRSVELAPTHTVSGARAASSEGRCT